MILLFPIMLIDGLNEIVSSLNSQNESIKIPKNLLVQDTAELNTLINKNFASFGEQKLARLPGCPKEIIMEVDGKKFNITSDILKKSDYCDYNVPINASIKLPKEKAIWLMQKSLYSSGVYLSALFETRVPYTVSKFSIEMNKSKLH